MGIEVKQNIDTYEKIKEKLLQKKKKSKKKKKFPLEPDEDYAPDEVDYEFIEENNEVVQDNIAYDDFDDLVYDEETPEEEVLIKGEPVTEDFEEEEEMESNQASGSKTNQTKIKISLKNKTVTNISQPNEPEVYTEIDEEEGEFEGEEFIYDEIKTEDYDPSDSSHNIQIENTFTETVKTEDYTDGDDMNEDHEDIPYEEEEYDIHDDYV